MPPIEADSREQAIPSTVGRDRGAWWDQASGCWRFALFSAHATAVEVLLFRRAEPDAPSVVVPLERHGDVWAASLPGAQLGDADVYGFRVDGPFEPHGAARFDRSKLLLDPYAPAVWFPPRHDRAAARVRGHDTVGQAPLAILGSPVLPQIRPRPRLAPHERVVVEAHVRGTSASPHSPVSPDLRGTLAGMIGLLGYWAELGVTVVELMPIHQYDPQEGNYWGYMPLAFGAVHAGYVAGDDGWTELAAFVDAAHRAGIHVWLDVVFNHTTEEDSERGPVLSHRGIDRESYYLLHPDGRDVDDAGCGNVLRAGHRECTALILAALDRFADAGVDGFRFDLASLLGRDDGGHPGGCVPAITTWGARRTVALVAEAWDLARYELGDAFAGRTWAQWNGRFRDDVRSFLRGDDGFVPALALRMQGSPDVFGSQPWRSVNYITSHDGFTLYDLFSYDRKHNDANGWGGADGADDNRSWNCGHEGDDGAPPEVLALRRRQMRNAFCLLMLAAGAPMFVAGDEFAQTQGGNNNPYNQDNETTWLDWRRLAQFDDLRRFVRELIALRRSTPSIGRIPPWHGLVRFYGVDGAPDLSPHSHSLAWCLSGAADSCQSLYVIVNAWWEPLDFEIQQPGPWFRAIDTSLASPDDIVRADARPPVGANCVVGPRSVVVLTRPFTPDH